ncbi:hypothetical protein HOY82DRAFT_543067 [Tuber indicum]|nr:hypothetical protein HOY82DRAFT_543067 [Tuber indicum]
MPITAFLERTIITNTAAGDIVPTALTDTIQIIDLVSGGTEHVLGLTREGNVYSWAMQREDTLDVGTQSLWPMRDTRSQHTGENIVVVLVPTVVQDLKGYKIVRISTREQHSAAVNEGGDLLVWGCLNSGQLSLDSDTLTPDVVRDASGKPRSLSGTHVVLSIRFPFNGCGTCHIIATSGEGRRKIENAATRGIKMVFYDAGGRLPIRAGIPLKDTNGAVWAIRKHRVSRGMFKVCLGGWLVGCGGRWAEMNT